MKLWIVLTFLNEYEQHGGYFSGVFESFELAANSIDHFGRRNDEYKWYEIYEIMMNQFVPANADGLDVVYEHKTLVPDNHNQHPPCVICGGKNEKGDICETCAKDYFMLPQN